MRHYFLVGPFLPGYASVFRYNLPSRSTEKSFDHQTLAKRFSERAIRFTIRQKKYTIGLQTGLSLALVLMLMAFTIPFSPASSFEVVQVEQELVSMEEILQTRQEVMPPPPPRPMIPIALPDDEVIEEVDLNLDASLELDQVIVDLPPPPPPVEEESAPDEPEIFVVVEQMPEMIGGMANLLKAVQYPTIARNQGIQGDVVVQVVVNEEGIPSDPTVLKTASPLLNEAAIKAVMLQRFKPGRQRGRAVKTFVAIPVRFRLSGS